MLLIFLLSAILVYDVPAVFADQSDLQCQCDLQCEYGLPSVPIQWIHMSDECIAAVTELLNLKLSNSVQYLAFGAYFSRDSVNRPGFSYMFYRQADEDREDAIELIDYVLMRGKYTAPDDIIQLFYTPSTTEWNSASEAVDQALDLETTTTDKFHDVISVCEQYGGNDYNIANWLSQYFLHDQYDNQKYFADLTSSLLKMQRLHQNFGEFLTDKLFCD